MHPWAVLPGARRRRVDLLVAFGLVMFGVSCSDTDSGGNRSASEGPSSPADTTSRAPAIAGDATSASFGAGTGGSASNDATAGQAPTTTVEVRTPGTTPRSPDGVPLLTPEVSFPGLVVAAAMDLMIAEGDPSRGDTAPRIQFADDGSLLVMDLVALTVNAYGVDGSVRWSVPLPAEIDGASPWLMEVGPEQVLYVSYRRSVDESFLLAAIATSGVRGGQLLATWPTRWDCVETFCGDIQLSRDGVVLDGSGSSGEEVAPYVDALGAVGGITFLEPARAEQSQGFGPEMPAGWATVDEYGNTLWSSRTSVTLAERTWVFDVIGVRQAEGTYAFFDAQSDGSVISTFALTDDAAAPGQLVWLDLLPDGSVSAFRLPPEARSLYAARVVDGERYVVVREVNRLRLLQLMNAE